MKENGTGWDIKWPAPAKINRFLHIIGQRKDGYHLLQSVFQFLDIYDLLQFSQTNDNKITLKSNFEDIPESDNLVFKAAQILKMHSDVSTGVTITLNKNLPSGAGLGGGSSDAATTLIALNHLWGLHLPLDELAKLGVRLGADVPFFVMGETAFVEGIGEKITPIVIDSPCFLLQIPQYSISTKKIFSNTELKRDTTNISLNNLTGKADKDNKIIPLGNFGHNDCEPVVLKNYPEMTLLFDWIRPFSSARLTGTGSCVFSMFDNATEAGKIALRCPDSIHCLVTKGLQYSPVHELLSSL